MKIETVNLLMTNLSILFSEDNSLIEVTSQHFKRVCLSP